MKALAIIGLFAGVAVALVVGMFWVMAATTPNQSHLNEQVQVTVLSATEETRKSSVSRYGFRVQYSYEFDGTTYIDDQFVPLRNWQPGQPLRACLDPDSPARHAVQLNPEPNCDGSYAGTEQTARPE